MTWQDGRVMRFTNLIELDTIQFAESGTATWIQAMPLGEYDHPIKGKLKFDLARAQRFAENVKNNVRGTDLDIDYDHKALTTAAAGWIKDAKADPETGLSILVEWTPPALAAIRNKEFRYFSPEYVDTWKHPKTLQTFTDVLFGGAITNRPFLKDIAPINLSEVLSTGGSMLKELAQLLGLPEDADEATILAKAQEAQTSADENAAKITDLEKQIKEAPAPTDNKPADKAEADSSVESDKGAVETVAANDPVVTQMSDRILQLETALRLTEVNGAIAKLTEGAKFAIAPALLTEVRALALEAPTALSDKFMDLMHKITKDGLVALGEAGHATPGSAGASATKRFTDAVESVALSDGIEYADAAAVVAAREPALYEEYRNESYLKERA